MKSLLVSVVVLLLLVVSAFAQQTKPQMMKQGKMADCQAMMERHKEMQSQMAQMDQKLSDLVMKMNAAKGNDKVEAVAAVVNELADQRKRMHKRMADHQGMMMKHMGAHMQAGASSMMDCPMMKEMKQTQSE